MSQLLPQVTLRTLSSKRGSRASPLTQGFSTKRDGKDAGMFRRNAKHDQELFDSSDPVRQFRLSMASFHLLVHKLRCQHP
mmetsp:Transcript_74100/g.176514  ORF Transcript_74100/g.176514 Transcript_74100/m.176514 type:complete len:80 (-) Transcript_74100:1961-2200(-)